MKKIEFRAWLKREKQMVDIREINFVSEQISFETKDDILFALFDEIELMQYVGIKDKNGKKIFEGDILNICGFIDRDVVEYDNYYVSYVLKSYDKNGEVICITPLIKYSSFNSPKLEVIGNIYDNPELLEVE